jgi:hypothetical protein
MASSEKQKEVLTVPHFTDNIVLPLESAPPITTSNPPEFPVSPNPWQEEHAALKGKGSDKSLPPSLFDQPAFADLRVTEDILVPKNNISKDEVLHEFDPLANMEEKAAREAWADSEGHLPTHPPRTPSPPMPPMKDLYISSPTSSDGPPHTTSAGPSAAAITSPTPFASFTSFAKNLAFPLVRSRPQSVDGSAKAVSTPTLGSFAGQQEGSKVEGIDTETSNVSESTAGDESPSSYTKLSDGAFDFQKFLDQMKSKSADPVSRYLRS